MYDVIVFEDRRSSNDQPGFSKTSFRGPFSKTPFTCVDETWKSETPLVIRTQVGRVIAVPELGRLSWSEKERHGHLFLEAR